MDRFTKFKIWIYTLGSKKRKQKTLKAIENIIKNTNNPKIKEKFIKAREIMLEKVDLNE